MKFVRRFLVATSISTGLLAAAPAQAWDPSTTHIGLTQKAAVNSAIHSRWMRGSELQRGLFSPLRVDPALLTPAELRLVQKALRNAPAASGARALGGPGACPGAQAPRSTQRFCVSGDLWQLSALGWLELGVVAELTPPDRATHHFVDRTDRSKPKWRDPSVPGWLIRSRSTRSNGAPLAGQATRTNFAGSSESAVQWLADEVDPLAPTRLHYHLERAYTSASAQIRDHHLALALLCTGALLHVVQDMSVPAHARGDAAAFFQPLSEVRGDRGLLLQEYAKLRFGRRGIPELAPEATTAVRGRPLADSLLGHILGGQGFEGLATFAATRFLSTGRLAPAQTLSEDLSPEQAAQTVLMDSGLDPIETEGAKLAPWPSTSGYVLTATGRPLAAFERDGFGRVRTFLDEAVFRDSLALLLPQALDVSRSVLDHLWPAWPATQHDPANGTIEFDVPGTIVDPVLLVLHQRAEGERKIVVKSELTPGKRNRVRGLPTKLGEAERLVLVLRGKHPEGGPVVLEHILAPTGEGIAGEQLVPTAAASPDAAAPTDPEEEEVEGLLELGEDESLTIPEAELETSPTMQPDPSEPPTPEASSDPTEASPPSSAEPTGE